MDQKNNEEYQKEITISSPIRVPQMSLKRFDIGRSIGKGQFGHVYIAREKNERLYNNIENNIYFALILEYAAKGELYKKLVKSGRLKEKKASRYVVQIVGDLNYIHRKHIIHRDIKPENLLIDLNDEIKIRDFGWRKTFCGILDYLPPEMIEGKEYDEKIDIWSLGVLCYELLTSTVTFEELVEIIENQKEIIRSSINLIWKATNGGIKEIVFNNQLCLAEIFLSDGTENTENLNAPGDLYSDNLSQVNKLMFDAQASENDTLNLKEGQ
ncbi:4027_t:CDS:2 [Racocetra persica]|uniref:4027_t:CDS:1 n=1 Tax=Racocetra persica TaxID=160502 RepID=A0ACA9N2Z8_9GLOM|nr:4027_t:CDS:2 [Racocetra persica]